LSSGVTTVGPNLVSGQADCDGAVYEIVYTATDDCGRSASCTQRFTISNAGPQITCPLDLTVQCTADISAGTPIISGACSLSSGVTTVGPNLVSGQADCSGAVYEIVYTATDDCGRSASCTQTFTLSNDGPQISCPADAIVECAAQISSGTATATTSCGVSVSVDSSNPVLVCSI